MLARSYVCGEISMRRSLEVSRLTAVSAYSSLGDELSVYPALSDRRGKIYRGS